MKHLEDALRQHKTEETKQLPNHFRQKSKTQLQKWTLDPDFVKESPQEVKERLVLVISAVLKKKFECEKYLEQETFRDLLRDLITLFPHYSSELEKLTKIEEILQNLTDSFSGELKNYLKQFQSLLDAKIRKIKKRGKRAELIEFDKFVTSEAQMKKKNEVYYINEDDKGVKYPAKKLRRQKSNHNSSSKRSFGTMNSASNENESGSGKNQSGSGSKSGESNALAVLLANIDAQQQRKGTKNKQKQKEKYEFTSILNATANIRQRNNSSRLSFLSENYPEQQSIVTQKLLTPDDEEKDEAFIFHHPKRQKHNKL